MARSSNRTQQFEQLTLDAVRYNSGRGGPRRGAGRPRGARPRVMHRPRERIVARVPVHVTIRLRRGIPTLAPAAVRATVPIIVGEACVRHGFRVVHYSIQRDHLHLLIEAQNNRSIACGMKSVGARIGKLANRLFQRSGKVLDGRYHLRPLRTPLEVRRALRYVLLNHRHHAAQRRNSRIHRRAARHRIRRVPGAGSTAGSRYRPSEPEGREVAPARTWLLQTGWRRHGLIDLADVP